ncbi:MAG: peptidylprolyl isomerase [Candidatus Kapabacteria bacterium]|nr:peptidylprolyl isomerase [Candidatus Kapabacteria bacterium]
MNILLQLIALAATSAIIAAGAIPAAAQPIGDAATMLGGKNRTLVDGVAAVVGNEIILVSDVVQRARYMAQQSRGAMNPADPKVLKGILQETINEKLLLTRAREDSVVASEEEVNRALDYRLQQLIRQVGSESQLEKVYGMSMEQIRRESRELIRQQLLVQRLTETRFDGLKVSDHDLNEFYQKYRDSLPNVPEQVELQQIVLLDKPTDAAVARTIDLARAITDSVKAGGDFADFARRYSTDAYSAKDGGNVGWVKWGEFVSEYDSAAKALGINEYSGPVRSMYGIHVIQLLEKNDVDRKYRSRHILLKIEQSAAERDTLVAQLKSYRARALAGENFGELARQFSQDNDTKALGGAIGLTVPDQLPNDLKKAIETMKEGEITEPLPVKLSPTEGGYHIVRFVRRVPAHAADPVQDRSVLEPLALKYKQGREMEKWIEELREEIYWDIKATEFE